MFYSQVILAKKGPLAKVWLAAHWGDKKLARPQIFATDISQSCVDIMNPSVPLALRLSGHLLLGVVRIYSRKVKYVLNDCTEAMLKLQMAFLPASSANKPLDANGNPKDGRELLQDLDGQQLVQNFGEFDQVHVVEGFCLPLPEDNEWILADDEDNNDNGNGQDSLLLAAHLPTKSQQQSQFSPNNHLDEEEEETWAPFDPDNEDDDDEEDNGLPSNSRVSDIEIVRAANDSLLSEDQTRRSSLMDVDKSALTTDSALQENAQQPPQEEDFDFNVPFGDDDSEDEQGQGPADTSFGQTNLDDSALQLSKDGGTPLSMNNASGLAMDDDMNASPNSKRDSDAMTKKPARKRRRKRRKVIIDNHETELTNDHIRHMLSNTDDLVLPMVHPASVWDENSSSKTYKQLVLEERARQLEQEGGGKSSKSKPKEAVPSLTQPFLLDSNSQLHPKLQAIWKENYWKALGEPCPYPKLQEEDDVEELRRDVQGDEESSKGELSDVDVNTAKEPEQPLPEENEDNFEFPTAVDDEEEEEEMDVPVPDFGDDEEEEQGEAALKRSANDSDDELLDLGMVNDMVLDSDEEENSDDEARQAIGDVSSSSTKWHKHTVRVYKHLKKCIKNPNSDDNDDDDDSDDQNQQQLPDSVDFSELTKHVVSRRNASSIFFEMLQLKTWDFIEVDQDESYGRIAISAGVRFGEDAPNN